ncbi:histidine phosphatase family protein [Actinomyces sp. B33]|uniref:histidine phosphatase family protein n=1 Tax=Actinomyces sp. B33 TaxID=2942131 RepID=UPI0023410234|nr:histidine phosphatase family protein [Actinomyces sp. B33]MDC4233217.1 histidine phosphatase family protein [Actinomyces sp. B33]
MLIVLVRHGRTYANALMALDTARPGLPLTEEGLAQASRLAERWESEVAPAPSVVAVSPLTRTRQTAAPLCARFGVEPMIRPGLRELRSGDLEMNDDLLSDLGYHTTVGTWSCGGTGTRMGGGETGDEARARALPVVREVGRLVRERAGEEGVGALIAHGALIRLLASTLADNIDGGLVMRHFMGNTGTVVLRWPRGLDPEGLEGLVGALHALTWNDRPVGDWT